MAEVAEVLYRRCQEMAERAGRAEYQAFLRRTKKRPGSVSIRSGDAQRWVSLFEAFRKGQVDEEHVKGCLLEGQIPESSPVPYARTYVIGQSNRRTRRRR